MSKPVVRYAPSPKDYVKLGESALIEHPIDHASPYVSNTMPIITSQVVMVRIGGEFETRNTLYVPA